MIGIERPARGSVDALADQRPIAFVVRVHRHGRVAEHRLRARRRDDELAAALDGVTQVPELAALLRAQHLEIRERRVQHRVPVHEALTAVDQALLVQTDEHLDDGARQLRVHRERVARPVHRCPEAAQLPRDRVARAFLPLPHALEELVAAERDAARAFAVQLALDDHLRRDAGVVRARLPERVAAAHSVVARERVHDRVLQRVTHVQRAGHVRRRNHDAVRLAAARGRKVARALPTRVVVRFDLGGSVVLVQDRGP